ncbi:MAG: 50S ribosomal protein L32e [Candidatus Thorarchaeota archaeon]
MSKKPQLSDIPGIGDKLEEKLREAGVKTVLNLSRAKPDKLAAKVDGLSAKRAESLIAAAQELIPAKEEKKPAKKKAKPTEEKPKAKPKKVEKEEPKKPKKAKKAPKAKPKKTKVEVPARVKAIDQRVLRVAQNKKKYMPRFRHEQAHRWTRVGDSWRKVRGIDSATRQKRKGRVAMVSSGYRTPKITRHLHPSLYEEVHVYRPADLEGLNPELHAIRIGATVGERKRQAILEVADKREFRVLNPGIKEEIDEEDLFTDLEVD